MANTSSLSSLLAQSRLMAEGIRKRTEQLKKAELTETSAQELEILAEKVEQLNAHQEELKALLKTKTAEFNAEKQLLMETLSKDKKAIKYFIDKNDWKTFGIEDKR